MSQHGRCFISVFCPPTPLLYPSIGSYPKELARRTTSEVADPSRSDYSRCTDTDSAVGDADEMPLPEVECRDRSDEVASLLFTSGTTGDPKGDAQSRNFTAFLASLQGTFRVDHRDRFLSVLPLFHTFEFSCGLLMPLSVGAHVMYMEQLEGGLLRLHSKSFAQPASSAYPHFGMYFTAASSQKSKTRGRPLIWHSQPCCVCRVFSSDSMV